MRTAAERKPRDFRSFNALEAFVFLASEMHSPLGEFVFFGNARVSHLGPPHFGDASAPRGDVNGSSEAVIDQEIGCAEQLARFFPQTAAVRLPVQVTVLRGAAPKLRESTVLEFGSEEHAIFVSALPLEFDDHVRLQRDANHEAADATVVAVQYHEGRKALAVRFRERPCDWMMQP